MSDNNHIRQKLLTEYHPQEKGTWRILGEDPNCDFGGHHHEPDLGSVTGTYENVVDYALNLKGFFQWGGGGRIVKVTPTLNVDKLQSAKVRQLNLQKTRLEHEIASLTKQLAEVNDELLNELSLP